MNASHHINGRVLVVAVLGFLLLVVAGLYSIAPVKVFVGSGVPVLARGTWVAGLHGTHERWWTVGAEGLVQREVDFDGDRRADCRLDVAQHHHETDVLRVKVDGRWQLAPDGVADCLGAMPAALREKFGKE